MGRTTDFAKRRIAGYVVFWFVILIILYIFYEGHQPAQAIWLFVLAVAITVSLAYTRRMKRKQRERREAAQRTGR